MPNSTTKENQHQQKFPFSSTTICSTTNFNNKTRSTIWGRTTGYGRGRLGPRNHRACWEIETRGNKKETAMADEQERIRRCVREELEPYLVSRTRNLIHSAASSSAPKSNSGLRAKLYKGAVSLIRAKVRDIPYARAR